MKGHGIMGNGALATGDGAGTGLSRAITRLAGGLTIPVTVVLALFIIKAATPISYDPDLYWHLKTGEYIVTTWSLPYEDIFSHTAFGKDWVLHEWLAEVVFYAVASTAGLNGLWIFVATIYAATFFVLYRLCESLLGDRGKAILVALLFFAPFVAFASPRPQIFTYLLFSLYLAILVRWKYAGDDRGLKFLPPMMLLWVNLHGAAIVGIALLGLFLAAEALMLLFQQAPERAGKARLKKLAFWATVTVLVTLANPRHVHFWLFPFYVMNLTVAISVINEWKSPNFHSLYYRYFLVLFLGFFAVLAWSRRRPDVLQFGIPAFFITAGFTSVRHLAFACIATLPFCALALRDVPWPSLRRFRGKASEGALSRDIDRRYVPYLNALLLCMVIAAMAYNNSRQPNHDIVDAKMPVKAADFILDAGISGRMFNEYGQGGYLIYRLHPAQQVFIDGRADMYGDAFMKEYLAIVGGKSSWKEGFERYGIDYALLRRETPLRQLLLAGREFRLVYDDPRYSVLVRDIPKFSHLRSVASETRRGAAYDLANSR